MTVSSEKKEKKEKKLEKKKRKCLYGLRWKNLCNLNSWVAFRNNFIDVAKKKSCSCSFNNLWMLPQFPKIIPIHYLCLITTLIKSS